MTLPDETLAATVARMRAERETVAAQRTAEGLQKAAAIRADAEKEARKVVAEASETAAHTDGGRSAGRRGSHLPACLSERPESLRNAALAGHDQSGCEPQHQHHHADRCRAVPGPGRRTARRSGNHSPSWRLPAPASDIRCEICCSDEDVGSRKSRRAPEKAPVPNKDVTTAKAARRP